jgi:hypothetical protein
LFVLLKDFGRINPLRLSTKKNGFSGGNSMAQMHPQDQMFTGASSQAATKLTGFHILKHKVNSMGQWLNTNHQVIPKQRTEKQNGFTVVVKLNKYPR